MWNILIKETALRELESIPKDVRERIRSELLMLKEGPFALKYKKLKGQKNILRIRQGDYRIIYSYEEGVKEIHVLKIGKRENIYSQ
ncbi:MAG: type II toxin-antitoxin system RelE family toxin [Candidatus Bilamarchaeaceae archaeon]